MCAPWFGVVTFVHVVKVMDKPVFYSQLCLNHILLYGTSDTDYGIDQIEASTRGVLHAGVFGV